MKINDIYSDPKEVGETTSPSLLEKYLKSEGQVIRNILDNISIGILIINYKKRSILFSNNYYDSIAPNYKKDEILGIIYEYIDTNINAQKKLEMSQDMMLKGDGQEYLLSFTTYCVSDDVFVVLLDEISSAIMYFMNKQENKYFNKLSDLIAEMVHEMANPLSGINTSLQVLRHNISNWSIEKITNYVERTINEINRLSEFLARMREVSDENKLEIKPTNLKKIIDGVLFQNDDLLKQQEITYKNMVDEDIIVLIDELAFHQIILNLLNNSLNILNPGNEIKIFVEEIDEFYVRLIYWNNGKPIPEELMVKIFSPLYTTKAQPKGIGLAISLKLITRMGGTMKAISTENGIGAKFVIYVPNSNRGRKEKMKSE